MNRRDTFAGMAMQGILSSTVLDTPNGYTVNDGFIHFQNIAKHAYEMADEMMEMTNHRLRDH